MSLMACGNRQLDMSRPHVMGILNATPDSFSDGGQFNTLDAALKQAESMCNQGASIIDVGGESTRPGALPVSPSEELDRVLPVVEAIVARFDVLVSVDTSTPDVMVQSAKVGAHLINDVRALMRDGALEAASSTGLPVCLMHMQGEPGTMQDAPSYDDVLTDIGDFFQARLTACESAGIERSRILLDPGFGFGKTCAHNYRLLNQLNAFDRFGCPLLVGMSRKRMIAQALNLKADAPMSDRMVGSMAAAVIACMKGASIVRVHDVKATVDAMHVVQATQQNEYIG